MFDVALTYRHLYSVTKTVFDESFSGSLELISAAFIALGTDKEENVFLPPFTDSQTARGISYLQPFNNYPPEPPLQDGIGGGIV